MTISDLSGSTLEEVIACLLTSFEGYFVKMPQDLLYWETRFHHAGVDWNLSSGVYDNQALVGFIIHAVDDYCGRRTAFNTGTGVLPSYRGQGLVDKMYKDVEVRLREAQVQRCALEVIDKNEKAVRVYKRCGFNISHTLKCYSGRIAGDSAIRVEEIPLNQYPWSAPELYSWDNSRFCIERAKAQYSAYMISDRSGTLGYCILNPSNGYLAQVDATEKNWKKVMRGIASVVTDIKINNIHASREHLVWSLDDIGLKNPIDQYFMVKDLSI